MNDLERIQKKLIKRNGVAKPKKKVSALDKYVIFSFACLLIFTVIVTEISLNQIWSLALR